MARIRFMDTSRNLFAAAALTAGSAATGLPAANAQHPDRAKVWRSATNTTGQTLDIDLGSSQAVTCVALANHKRIGSGGLVNLRERGTGGSPGAPTTIAVIPAQDRDTRTASAFFGSVSARHWQLQFTNPSVVSDYVELGYAHLGTYFEPTVNIAVPAEIARPDPSVIVESVDGQATTARRTKFFRGSWAFRNITEAQLDLYRAMWDALGVSGVFFQHLDDSLAWTCWYARNAADLSIELAEIEGRYTLGFPWVENR